MLVAEIIVDGGLTNSKIEVKRPAGFLPNQLGLETLHYEREVVQNVSGRAGRSRSHQCYHIKPLRVVGYLDRKAIATKCYLARRVEMMVPEQIRVSNDHNIINAAQDLNSGTAY